MKKIANDSIFFIVNDVDFFISHRLVVALEAQKLGFDVHVISGSSGSVSIIESFGFVFHFVDFKRRGVFNFLKTLTGLFSIFSIFRPSIVHAITIKPILATGFISLLFGDIKVIYAFSGLGTVFVSKGVFAAYRKYFVELVLRVFLRSGNVSVIFQNEADQHYFVSRNLVAVEKCVLFHGSGVDLDHFCYSDEPKDRFVVTMASRLIRQKGVFDFVSAAEIINNLALEIEFQLIGDLDLGNDSSLTRSELGHLRSLSYIKVIGYQDDVAPFYAASSIVCLPSYREGLPKCLSEAAACGRPVVTTDVPGCRDAVIDGVTGILVPVRNPVLLASAIIKLYQDDLLRLEMGRAARELAEKRFDRNMIADQHCQLYLRILGI